MRSTRRSAKKTQELEAHPPEKKMKHDMPKIGGFEARFEWQEMCSKWTQFTPAMNAKLVEAYCAGNKQEVLALPSGMAMVVYLDTMVQTNEKTKYERLIRVALKGDSDTDFHVWAWQENPTTWKYYSVETSVELEQALQSGKDQVSINVPTATYQIDLSKMCQTNTKTKFSRLIRREIPVSDILPDEENQDSTDEIKLEIKESKNTVKNPAEDNSKTTRKGTGKSRSGTKTIKSVQEEPGTKSSMKTVVMKKGSAPVDDQCPIATKNSVYEAGKVIWDCMLNQTNISNNNNKYYLIQLLQEQGKNSYSVWQRWGRVGYKGQTNLLSFGSDLDGAMKAFTKKFKDKTGNEWAGKDFFIKYPGKYDLIQMDYAKAKDEEDLGISQVDEGRKIPESKLDKNIQELIQLICDVKSMEEALVEMKYDAKKAPLGKLTKEQIKAGYEALQNIEVLIQKKDFGPSLSNACSEFYTRIPHVFGMQTPPLIRSTQMVKEKIALLEALEDVEIAIKMLKGGDMSENPIDRHYHQLHCAMEYIDHRSNDFKLVDKYLQQTHASTHNQYKMELLDVFACNKEGEDSNFLNLGNRMLLWHGSRLTNWAGILGQGLRIAPPEAPVTGYMFGKGVYFADMSSKSANYCFATKSKNTGLLLLCDVSLGQVNDKMSADYNADKLPKGKHSVRGVGRVAPDPAACITLPDGLVVPAGQGKDMGTAKPGGYTLNYNEYIVYDVRQIKMKYLVKVKFNFK